MAEKAEGPTQPALFGRGIRSIPVRIGHAEIALIETGAILTRASGFMADYDYTLNPYSGCSYGCTYCYAAFFSRDAAKQESWGHWVEVEQNAVERLRRMRTDLSGRTVYMSSVTDPYQPVERTVELVRELLPVLADRGIRLVVQTRSPLVTRDIELFRRFEAIRVNMTVTTDSEAIRRVFEPHCPTSRKRLDAIAEVAGAGIPTAITMTPLLPIQEVNEFVQDLLGTGVQDFVVQPFHAERGRFVAGTREDAIKLLQEHAWTADRYRDVVRLLRAQLPRLTEGREGFAPA